MTDLDELKRLASAATPGPWTVGGAGDQVIDIDAPNGDERLTYYSWEGFISAYGCLEDRMIGSGVCRANAHFIAAANPAVVMELIEEIEDLRRQLDTMGRY